MAQRPSRKVPLDKSGVSQEVVKMWILDVINSPADHPFERDVIIFQNVYVKKVQLCGVVTECRQFGIKTEFKLDDGTGSILCTFNYHRSNEMAERRTRNLQRCERLSQTLKTDREREVAKAMVEVLEYIQQRRPCQGEIKVGEHRVVAGFVTRFFGDRRINVFEVSHPLSEEEVGNKVVRMVTIYRDIYNKTEKDEELKEECLTVRE